MSSKSSVDFSMSISGLVIFIGLGMDLLSGIDIPIGTIFTMGGSGILLYLGKRFKE